MANAPDFKMHPSTAGTLFQRIRDRGPAAMGSLVLFAAKLAVKSVIFGVPVAFVAQWCDMPPTWKSIAFMMFCIIWSDCVFDAKGDRSSRSNEHDDRSGNRRKTVAEVLTPAQVAAEARKLSR